MTFDLDDDVDPVDPEIRRAKFVLFLLTVFAVLTLIIVLLIFFQPDNQLVITRYPNGYPKTETHFVMSDAGRLVEHGAHRAYHENGSLAEKGTFENGVRTGKWQFLDEGGALDEGRSGIYEDGSRVGPLDATR